MTTAFADDWRRHAACFGMPAEMFFPERGGDGESARAICAGCVVRQQCLDDALDHETTYRFGIVGGLSANERRRFSSPHEAC